MSLLRERILNRLIGGHIRLGPVVIFGRNAMHYAMNIRTRRWGYICFHPTMRCFGKWWPWYFYISPDATPNASTFAIGPGLYADEKRTAPTRRRFYGHNFSTEQHPEYRDPFEVCSQRPPL